MEKKNDPAIIEIERLALEIECCTRNLGAVHDVMSDGLRTPESYMNALFFSYISFESLQSKLQACVARLQDEWRAE